MFMHKSKKGFTIVELVIVIAVIAILAAVLIPTFSNLVKKANIANDTALAKNLNTALTADEAVNGKATDFSKVLSVLRADGYIVENLNPTTAGHFFVWESESNQILLVDEQYKVVYSSKDLTDATDSVGKTWFFAVKDEALIAELKDIASVIPAVDTAWVGTDGAKMAGLLKTESVVTLNENITLETAPRHSTGSKNDALRLEGADLDVTYNLAGQTMTVTTDFDTSFKNDKGTKTGYSVIHAGDKANVVVADGNIVASVQSNENGLSLYGILRAYGNAVATVENMNIVYNGVDNGTAGSGAVFTTGGPATLTVKDTVVTFANTMGAEIGEGTATFENVTFKSVGDGGWNDICVGVSYGGTATIKSGTYIGADGGQYGDDACVGVLPSGGTLNIEGGTFRGNLYIGTQSGAKANSIITITGGTFNGKAFSSLTATEWKALCVGESSNTVVVNGAGTNSVTLKVAK